MGNEGCKLQCRKNSFKTLSYQANCYETNEKNINQLQQATSQSFCLNKFLKSLNENSTEHKATKQLSFQLQQISNKKINLLKTKQNAQFRVQIKNKLISSLNQKQLTSESINMSINSQIQQFDKFKQKDQILTKSVRFNQGCSNRDILRQVSLSLIRKNQMKSLCPNNNYSHKKINFSVDLFVKTKKKKIQDEYLIQMKIGQGGFGSVYKAKSVKNNSIVAVKIFKKKVIRKTSQVQKLNTQIQILKSLDHPNIVKIIDIFHNDQFYYIVMQYYGGGTLKDFLSKPQKLKDYSLIKIIFKQILYGLAYLHSKEIIHRDIKFQNIVFQNDIDSLLSINDVQIKIIDFGLSLKQKFKGINKDVKKIGTPKFMAPEVLIGQYSQKSDVWSCGIMLFTLLKGQYPFKGISLRQLLQKISNDQIDFNTVFWKSQDQQLVRLLKNMLQKNFLKRVSSVNALKQNWLSRKTHKIIDTQKQIISKKLLSNRQQNNFIRLIQYYIVSRISNNTKDKKSLVQLFEQIDQNNNGIIQAQQLASFFPDFNDMNNEKNSSKSSIDKFIQKHSGKLQISQFMALISERKQLFTKQNLNSAFQSLDSNKNGFIQIKQLRKIMRNCDSQQFNQLIQDIDQNEDERISKQQFLDYFKFVQGCDFD